MVGKMNRPRRFTHTMVDEHVTFDTLAEILTMV